MEAAKLKLYDSLEKYGFFMILLCASIPNPLFDLAGITCGHLQIPFRTFFSAIVIGKSFFKTHIQMIFVILVVRPGTVKWIVKVTSSLNETLKNAIVDLFENQKAMLHSPQAYN